ncbi:MAG: MarR family transcriptional regulator [Aeromicrobium sp.]
MVLPKKSSDLVDLILDQWSREAPDLDAKSVAVLGRLHRCDVRYQGLVTQGLEPYGLSPASFDVLTSLRRSGPDYQRTAGELAEIGLITTGGLTQRINRLEADGLVERIRDDADRRLVYIKLTEQGLALIDQIIRTHFAWQDSMLGGLTKAEIAQLATLLSRLEVSLEVAERLHEDRSAS